MMIFSYQAR